MTNRPPAIARLSRVLFADDDPVVRKAFARSLRARGFIVDLAADGLEALALASEYPYALVVTDHQMPGLSGIELIGSIRRLQRDATFILVTGIADLAQRGAGSLGVSAVLGKPWRESELVDVVERAVDQANRRLRARTADTDPLLSAAGQFVLILEDSDFDATVLTRIVESAAGNEFRVVRAKSLAEACRLLKAREYSVVLADLSLPDAQGYVALNEIQAVAPGTPVLVVTGADDEKVALGAVQAGAQDYLLKGKFDGNAALRAIRYAVERKRIEKRLKELAHYDQLTGLANRTLLKDRVEHALSRAIRSGKRLALFLVDLDRFKEVNDTYGHETGDQLLVEVARRLSGSTRIEDTVARIGGDEFAVLLEDLNDALGARRVAQRMINAFATPVRINDTTLPVTPSIGIAMCPDDATTQSELMRHADAALYRSKAAGRNAYRFFSSNIEDQLFEQADIERDLLGALDEGRFSIVLQPQVELDTGAVVGFEAFLRWRVLDGRQANAGEFVSILDEIGDIVRVGRWVLDEACAEAARWKELRGRFSVNVSPREFAQADFVDSVRSALDVRGVSGEVLSIELTEHVFLNHIDEVRAKLAALDALGVSIAIDDYGAGRSSLVELSELPIRTLKLSESLVKNLSDVRNRAVLTGVVAAGKALGWNVVAKAVETREQLHVLREIGCPRAQGFLLGQPGPGRVWRALQETSHVRLP